MARCLKGTSQSVACCSVNECAGPRLLALPYPPFFSCGVADASERVGRSREISPNQMFHDRAQVDRLLIHAEMRSALVAFR